MGGKGGVGKTGLMVALAEWFEANEIPFTLLDLDTETKARGSLTLLQRVGSQGEHSYPPVWRHSLIILNPVGWSRLSHFQHGVVFRNPVFDFNAKLFCLDEDLFRFCVGRNIGEV
jgi:hypothetical protein